MPNTPLTKGDFSKFRNMVMTVLVVIAFGCGWGIYAVKNESNIRTGQFCSITIARANDQVVRFDDTVEYLKTPEGSLTGPNGALNKIIVQRSLPSLANNVEFDRTHRATVCEDIVPPYADTKYPKELKKYISN